MIINLLKYQTLLQPFLLSPTHQNFIKIFVVLIDHEQKKTATLTMTTLFTYYSLKTYLH